MTRRFLQSADVEINDDTGALLVEIGDVDLKVDMVETDVEAIVGGIAGASPKTLADLDARLSDAENPIPVTSADVHRPSWTDSGVAVIAPVALGRGKVERGTIDLRAKFGAYLFLGLGRGGTTVLTNGVNVQVRRTLNNDGILFPGAPHFAALSDTVAAYAKQIDTTFAVGETTLYVDGTGTPSAGEDLCFWGKTAVQADGVSLPDLEFLRVSSYYPFGGDAYAVISDSPIKVAKINDELFTNKANLWSVWCPGGCQYEAIFDYGDDAAGEAVAVVCYAQTLDSLTKVT